MQPQTKEDTQRVRTRILAAAGERFRQYGFGKTTMAEIAGDCGMSASNLYRYFENKHDIGAALANQCLHSKSQVLEEVVRDRSLSATAKIEAFILANLGYTYRQWSQQPRMNELVDAMTQSRSELVEQHLRQNHSLLRMVVDEGIRNGEFNVCDPEVAADALLTSIFMFDYPNVMSFYSLQDFQEKARALAGLVVNGLSGRRSSDDVTG